MCEGLAAIPEVCEVHATTGQGDLFVRMVARSNADLQRVVDHIVDVPHVRRTATRLWGVTNGNPEHCMTLVRSWVDRGLVHYADGAWNLPIEIPRDALRGAEHVVRDRLRHCSAPARKVAAILAVAGAPAPLELMDPLGRGPRAVQMAPDQARVDVEKRLADGADKPERPLRSVLEIVEEDPADAAVFAAVRQIEVLVRPRLEARIAVGVKRRAGLLEAGMKRPGVGVVGHDRVEIGAAAEPRPGRLDMPGVHVRRRHVRRARMRERTAS